MLLFNYYFCRWNDERVFSNAHLAYSYYSRTESLRLNIYKYVPIVLLESPSLE